MLIDARNWRSFKSAKLGIEATERVRVQVVGRASVLPELVAKEWEQGWEDMVEGVNGEEGWVQRKMDLGSAVEMMLSADGFPWL